MRKILLSSAAIALVAGSASAADLPVYVEPVAPAPIVDVAAYSFSGAWIGVQAGGVFGGELDELFDDDDEIDFDDLFDGDDDFGDDNTWEAGVAAGFDWQMGNFVFGVLGDVNWVHELGRGGGYGATYDIQVNEAEMNAADTGLADAYGLGGPDGAAAASEYLNSFDIPYEVVAPGTGIDYADTLTIAEIGVDEDLDFDAGTVTDLASFSEELNWYATARGRLGFAAGRFMFYGTGGLSYGNVESSWSASRTYDADAAAIAFAANDPDDIVVPDPLPGDDSGTIDEDVIDLVTFDPAEDLPDGCVASGADYVCSTSESEDDDRWGYALGLGTEFLVTQNFSIGAEYLYVNLGSGDDVEYVSDLPGLEIDEEIESDDFDFHTVKVRGAFRF